MLKTAKKSFSNPVWIAAFAAFVLVGCEDEVTSTIGGSDAESSEEGDEVDRQQEEEQQEEDGQEDVANEDGDNQDAVSSADNMATLMWDAPLQRENGDALKMGSIDNYVVSWGQAPGEMDNSVEVNCESCAEMEYVVEELSEGQWYFTVQTVDTDGNISREADAVSKNI